MLDPETLARNLGLHHDKRTLGLSRRGSFCSPIMPQPRDPDVVRHGRRARAQIDLDVSALAPEQVKCQIWKRQNVANFRMRFVICMFAHVVECMDDHPVVWLCVSLTSERTTDARRWLTRSMTAGE